MTRILDLAIEPFSQIISLITYRDLTALWLCGDMGLDWRLSIGKTVREVRFTWLQNSKQNWPPLVSEFHGLEKFVYISVYGAPDSGLKGHHLSTLSQDLKILNLKCDSSLEAFRELQVANPSHFRRLSDLQLRFQSNPRGWNFQFPRTLTKLSLEGPEEPLSLSWLPQDLTHLSCEMKTIEMGESKFPPSLVSLSLVFLDLKRLPSAFHHLPIGLENLSVIINTKTSFEGLVMDDWHALSRLHSLQALTIPVNASFRPKIAQMLPSSLEYLDLRFDRGGHLTEEMWIEILKPMSEKLKKLKKLCGFWFDELTPAIAQSLPRSLLTLDTGRFGGPLPDSVVVPLLPNSLEVLEFDASINWPMITSFPSQLKSLTIDNISIAPDAAYAQMSPWQLLEVLVKRIPEGLKDLTLIFGTALPIRSDIANAMPRGLKFLTWRSDATTFEDPMSLFASLPQRLARLEIVPRTDLLEVQELTRMPPEASLILSRDLRTISFSRLQFESEEMAPWILGLPNFLAHLTIGVTELQKSAFKVFHALQHLTYLLIEVLSTPKDGWAKFVEFQCLPPKLILFGLLNYSKCEDSDFTDEVFKGAPQSLQFLRIPNSPLLTQGCRVHLPNMTHMWYHPGSKIPSWL
jgi:hypothetical protein